MKEDFGMLIVPNDLRDAIYHSIDEKLTALQAGMVEAERERLYHELLQYWDDHGVIPEYVLTLLGEETP